LPFSRIKAKFAKAEIALINELPSASYGFGSDLVAMISNRVTQKGLAYDGVKFSPYSKKGVPAFLYYGRGRNASANNKISKLAKDNQLISYKVFRELNGFQTKNKDFSFTGDMWRSFAVQNNSATKTKFHVIIGMDKKNSFKAKYGSVREKKKIINPSKIELSVAHLGMRKRLQNAIHNALK